MSGAVCHHCGRYMRSDKGATGTPETATPRTYCSASCRRDARARLHRELEDEIIRLLATRDSTSSICPSEAARARFGDDFSRHMEDTRRAARRLAHREVVRITQRGRTVHPAEIRGPIRVERGAAFAQAIPARGSHSEASEDPGRLARGAGAGGERAPGGGAHGERDGFQDSDDPGRRA